MDSETTNRKLPFRLVYHDGYDLHLGSHVFPSRKYRLIREHVLKKRIASPGDFIKPAPVTDDELMLVHREHWVEKLRNGTLSYYEVRLLEVPYSRRTVNGFILATGGTVLAGECAMEDGVGYNIGGGFHHAFPDHGEGFCAVNDIAVAIRVMQQRGLIRKALVVDCDVHQGNGTAAIFAGAPDVFTISIHQENNYPAQKPPSSVDIGLPDGTGDQEYMNRLSGPVHAALNGFHPDICFYISGADPYCHDQLGGICLTKEGLLARDQFVFESSMLARVPVAVTLAGGYAVDIGDTVEIHANTILAARYCLSENKWRRKS